MAITQNLYTGNGSTTNYSFTFPYLEEDDVKVTLDGVTTTAYSFANATTLQFDSAPENGVSIRIYRDTNDESLSATFYPGSAIRAQDLNDNFTQNLYVTQEVNNNAVTTDGANPMVGDLDMAGYKVINLGDPTSDGSAVNKQYVDSRFGNPDIPGFTRWTLTAVGGETTLSGAGTTGGTLAYSAGREQVYLNGAQQQRGVDYTANSGTSVIFNVALTAGDVVEIICVNNLNPGTTAQAQDVYFVQSGAGAVTRSVENKLRDVVSVKDFGAVGDGVTDDTAAIQAAIDYAESLISLVAIPGESGVSVFVPSGDYKITSQLTIQKSSVSLLGEAGKGSRLFTASSSVNLLVIGDETDTVNQWENHVANIFFEATDKANTACTAIKVCRAYAGSITGCTFHGWNISILGERMNRYNITACNTFQTRTAGVDTPAEASILIRGAASGTGGGNHITDCELAGATGETVTAHIKVEETDGLYVVNTHTRDCTYAVSVEPSATLGKNIIDSLFFSNCYFDENHGVNARLVGSVGSGGRYQVIHFSNCYFRGANQSQYCVQVQITDAGATVDIGRDISFRGGSARQARVRAFQITGASSGAVNVDSLVISDIIIGDNNHDNNAALVGSGVQVVSGNAIIANCIFQEDAYPAANVIKVLRSVGTSGVLIEGNNLSATNCTDTSAIDYNVINNAPLSLTGNTQQDSGTFIVDTYKIVTTDATPVVAWSYTVPNAAVGFCQISASGSSATGTPATMTYQEAGFRRSGGTTILSTGTSSFQSVRNWNPDTITLPTCTLVGNTLTVTITGVAATTMEWVVNVQLTSPN